MKMRCTLTWSVLLAIVLSGQCCLVDKTWSSMSTYDLLDMADIVVYGRDTGHVERTGVHISTSINNVTDCLFQVYCVLKGNVTMKDITIEHISPLSGCSGSREKLSVGLEMIVALKMTELGNYKYYEGNALQSSVYESNAENFRTMDNVTKTSDWKTPLDAEEDTCQSAIEHVTRATNGSSAPPKNTTVKLTTQANDSSEPPKNTTVKPTTQTKVYGAKVGANLENSGGTVGHLNHLFLLTVGVLAVFN